MDEATSLDAGTEQKAFLPERIILAPEERRPAVLGLIRSARTRLVLSLFRCSDFKVLDELAEARRRNVRVQVLLTRHAKGWKKRLKELRAFLEAMGAEVHCYSGRLAKYHAKYAVADEGPALVASLNFTHKCFRSTCDFLLLTHDPEVLSGLKKLFEADFRPRESTFPEGISDRLIIAPEQARTRLAGLIQQARRAIHIIDHRVTDPEMLALLRAKRSQGIEVTVLGRDGLADLPPHGKMILVDESTAVIGSISLSRSSLDFRREVAVLVRDPLCIRQLEEFFQRLAATRTVETPAFPSPQDSAS